jgi:hypothetical protein
MDLTEVARRVEVEVEFRQGEAGQGTVTVSSWP